jgi:hypothetical protein
MADSRFDHRPLPQPISTTIGLGDRTFHGQMQKYGRKIAARSTDGDHS